MAERTISVVDYSLEERRRYRREQVELTGRQFVPADNREAVCKIADISLGGVRVQSDIVPRTGARVIIYIDGFGRFEGDVVRAGDDEFGVQFSCTEHKRERLSEQLERYVSGAPPERTFLRRHGRTQTDTTVSFTRASGEVVDCKLLDFSLSGVFVATEIRPAIGEFVLINGAPGRVARHHESGIAIEFLSRQRTAAEPVRAKAASAG